MSVSCDNADPALGYLDDCGIKVTKCSLRCCACLETIPAGHKYVDGRYVTEDDDGHEKLQFMPQCLRCNAIYTHLSMLMPSVEWCDWELDCGHGYEERWNRDPPPEIIELAFKTGEDFQ